MLCYLAGMEPYYLKCIKDGTFQPKTAEGDDKPEAKPTESLSQTYTRYKTLLNELAYDGDKLSKHEINVGFVNSLSEKWLTFSYGLRNANHTQTLDLADIFGSTAISTAFFSNNVIQDFQENSDDEVDERSMTGYSSVSKGFQPKFTPKLIQSSQNSISQADPKTPKTFQPKNKGLVVETFDWDEEEVSDDEEVTHVEVLMALADDELTIGKNHARNGEWIDFTMRKVNILLSMDEYADWKNYLNYINIDLKFIEEQRLNLLSKYKKIVFELNKCRDELLVLKQAKPDAITFQIQNTELTKLNYALQEQLKQEKKINEKWPTSSKKVSQCINEQIPHQKKKVLGGEMLTESS
ncbi:hypothetical protein Tco_0704632 [Tanacetum coccineum]|uniref:Retrovirus-related Pol polyprotein from transposon TNT 1-94 n=1 Tax=Tanacetum coccineum TaxID=301880 RepID=A0ABQ4Y3Q1_9ASTR